MTPLPVRLAEPVVSLVYRPQGDEECLAIVAGQRNQVVGAGAETFQSDQTLSGLERLLDPLSESPDPHQDCQGYRLG
ncbi:hypothetical protein SAMN04489731_106259 [Amycolatopsis regifaucium]|nr:hypothetical protein SAMN04489731_106259 [Amycolatopsis regifaucium]